MKIGDEFLEKEAGTIWFGNNITGYTHIFMQGPDSRATIKSPDSQLAGWSAQIPDR